jgi:hypothetical protein
MGLFNKKTKEVQIGNNSLPPTLPKLPKLPSIPGVDNKPLHREQIAQEPIPKLPKYPSNALGNKFSQDAIKESVRGRKEDDFEDDEDDFDFPKEMQKIPRPISTPMTEERKISKEPVFIRIDKFETSLHIFEKAKKQIHEIEDILSNIKKIREDEEKQLTHWEREIQNVKAEIERINQDIFSKI